MYKLIFVTLNLLLSLSLSTIPARASAASCYDGQTSHTTGITRISTTKPATLHYQPDQIVRISSDSGGNALNSAAMIMQVEPKGYAFTFGGGAADPQDISVLLAEGENRLTLNTGAEDAYWIITSSPCLVQKAETKSVKPAQAVIVPQPNNESVPAAIPAPVPMPDVAATPVPGDVTQENAPPLRLLLIALAIAALIARIMQFGWVLGAILLALAGLVVAYRNRRMIAGWAAKQIHIWKEAHS